jgi:rRNA maturation RNase YbeY
MARPRVAGLWELSLRNRQRTCFLDLRLLRKIAVLLLKDLLAIRNSELSVHFVESPEMIRLNEKFLRHKGSTDVITFNYSARRKHDLIHGDIFICTAEAILQARRFRATWQRELIRYLIHGLLHLQGYDDLQPAARQRMKRAENRLLGELAGRFALQALGRKKLRSGGRLCRQPWSSKPALAPDADATC